MELIGDMNMNGEEHDIFGTKMPSRHGQVGQDSNKPNPTGHASKDLHIAPMLDITTTEFHHFFRILTKRCVLWTEMIHVDTILHSSDLDRVLAFDHEATIQKIDGDPVKVLRDYTIHPIICQLGGRDPSDIARATSIVQKYGYDECNINMGCPSEKVAEKRKFGAILMKEPESASQIVEAMNQASLQSTFESSGTMNTSVKTRIGVDDLDSLDYMVSLISRLKQAGCSTFYLHSRRCILGGRLSARQNRSVPPLNYPRVYDLCRSFPDCNFIINGGITTLKDAKLLCYGTDDGNEKQSPVGPILDENNKDGDCQSHSVPCSICNASNGSCTAILNKPPSNLQGVMLGRAARDNPSIFWDADRYFYGCNTNSCRNRRQVLEQYISFLEAVYPRRCCDDDVRITRSIPAPRILNDQRKYVCKICQANDEGIAIDNDDPTGVRSKVRIAICVISRSIKPVLGLFFGLPDCRSWRRTCDTLSRDLSLRNCGPAHIIRRAMNAMPSEMLDMPFELTEERSYDT